VAKSNKPMAANGHYVSLCQVCYKQWMIAHRGTADIVSWLVTPEVYL